MRKAIIVTAIFLFGASTYWISTLPTAPTVAEKVIGGAVRIQIIRFDDPFKGGVGSGTIIALKQIDGQKYATILTAAHLINDLAVYEVGYVKTSGGKFIDISIFSKVIVQYIDRQLDLALIDVQYKDDEIDENLIDIRIYQDSDYNTFNKDIFVSSYPRGFGPVFSRGYINAPLIVSDKGLIGVYGQLDFGSSGAAIRDAKTGDIMGVVLMILGTDKNNMVLNEMTCVNYIEINKFLKEAGVVLD